MALQESNSATFLPQKDPLVPFDPSAFLADPELVQALEKRSTPLSCDADRVLFHQGDVPAGLYILQAGEATLSMRRGGEESLQSVRTAGGSLLGLPGVIGNQPYSLTAIVRGGSRVRFVSRADFAAFMQSEPRLSLKILAVLAAEVRSARHALGQR